MGTLFMCLAKRRRKLKHNSTLKFGHKCSMLYYVQDYIPEFPSKQLFKENSSFPFPMCICFPCVGLHGHWGETPLHHSLGIKGSSISGSLCAVPLVKASFAKKLELQATSCTGAISVSHQRTAKVNMR